MQIPFDDLDYIDDEGTILGLEGCPFSGESFELYDSGTPSWVGTYENGVLVKLVEFDEEESKHVAAEMRGGVYHGTVREWHGNGALKTETQYEFGVMLRRRVWSLSGDLVADKDVQLSEGDRAFLKVSRDSDRRFRESHGA